MMPITTATKAVSKTEQSIVHSYHTMTEAETAIKRLIDQQFPAAKISIVTQNIETEKHVHGYITTGDVAIEGATTGAWTGGLFGFLIGAAFIWVPGAAPLIVAGPFAAALLGSLEGIVVGSAAGGLLGALFGWGMSKEHILKYEEVIKGGDYLVIANGDEAQITLARDILDGLTPDAVYPPTATNSLS